MQYSRRIHITCVQYFILIPARAQRAIKRAAVIFFKKIKKILIFGPFVFVYLHAPNTPSTVPQGLRGAGEHVTSERDLCAAVVTPRASTNSQKSVP